MCVCDLISKFLILSTSACGDGRIKWKRILGQAFLFTWSLCVWCYFFLLLRCCCFLTVICLFISSVWLLTIYTLHTVLRRARKLHRQHCVWSPWWCVMKEIDGMVVLRRSSIPWLSFVFTFFCLHRLFFLFCCLVFCVSSSSSSSTHVEYAN